MKRCRECEFYRESSEASVRNPYKKWCPLKVRFVYPGQRACSWFRE